MAIPNYAVPVNFNHQQFVSPALALHQPPLNPLWSPDARPLDNTQDSRFENTWLDQNKCTQQELDIQREVIPFALDHNQRQYGGVGFSSVFNLPITNLRVMQTEMASSLQSLNHRHSTAEAMNRVMEIAVALHRVIENLTTTTTNEVETTTVVAAEAMATVNAKNFSMDLVFS